MAGEDAIRNGDVNLSGDAATAQRFQKLLEFARPDLEEELSRFIGDVAAHRIAEIARGIGDWARDVRKTMGGNIREYLQEESREAYHPAMKSINSRRRCKRPARRCRAHGCAGAAAGEQTLMANRRTIFRLIGIQRVLVKYGLDDLIKQTHLFRPLRFVFMLFPRRRDKSAPLGERIRLALEELGPIFIKFGQALSTRRDSCHPTSRTNWQNLQDEVPPFPADEAIAILDAAYGESVNDVFARFDREPHAAASIAQVHTAQLPDGQEVIVKVLRPGVQELIERDIEVLRFLASLAARYWEHGKRLRPREVVDEYENTIIDELDLMREAANTSQLKRNFAGSEMLYVPDIYWDFCRPEVMVQERIFGIPISDMKALRESGANIQVLAENGVEIFFTQVFRHNFFPRRHASGQHFCHRHRPGETKICCSRFRHCRHPEPGATRTLPRTRTSWPSFDRDYHRIAKLHIESGWVPEGTRIDQLESAVRTVCEPIFNKPLDEISFAQVLMRLFRVAQRVSMSKFSRR